MKKVVILFLLMLLVVGCGYRRISCGDDDCPDWEDMIHDAPVDDGHG